MAKCTLAFKSFFEPLPLSSEAASPARPLTNPAPMEDDSTESEQRCTEPLPSRHWQPQHDYEQVSIGELAPGSRRVSFTARVVNLYDHHACSKLERSAKGCLKVLVKDDSALILVC